MGVCVCDAMIMSLGLDIVVRCPLARTLIKMQAQRVSMRSAARGPALRAAVSRRSTVSVRADKVLIVNTKGGGHAFIGEYKSDWAGITAEQWSWAEIGRARA